MLPLVGAKVENETKDSLYLRCEVGCLNVAEGGNTAWLTNCESQYIYFENTRHYKKQ